jgi:hypothetical protein
MSLEMKTETREGGCLCGRIRYRIVGQPYVAFHCHCSDCRRVTGAAFLTWAVFPRDVVAWTATQPARFEWAGRIRLFCPCCGTALGGLPSEDAACALITVSSLDDPATIQPSCHTWIQDKLSWIQISDSLPAHKAGMEE